MKQIFIHVGLHKTRTTAIQFELFKHRNRLTEQNFYYPIAGIPDKSYGHHNIAWELSRDRRFQRSLGRITELINEISLSNINNFILSSEDFESSLAHPRKIQLLIDQFLSQHINVVLIIYFRNLDDYLISLYCELLKTGMGIEFSQFAQQIAKMGNFCHNEWEFCFDYNKVLTDLKSLNGANILIGNYNSLQDNDVVQDFSTMIGLNLIQLRGDSQANKINKRPILSKLLFMFLRNRGGFMSNNAIHSLQKICLTLQGELIISDALSNLISRRFDNSYAKSANVKLSAIDTNQISAERLFSFETHNVILELARSSPEQTQSQLILKNWHSWIKIN